jgi:hypothetical protein
MINQNTKDVIKAELSKQIALIGSAAKLSVKVGISDGTLSKIKKGKITDISDGLWLTLGAGLGLTFEAQWMHADTVPFTKMWNFFNDARLHAKVFGLVCHPGSGKTYTLNKLIATQKNVIHVKCVELMNTRSFYTEMLASLGMQAESYNLYSIQAQVIKAILKLESPVIIIDEIERVKSLSVFSQFIDLYNKLEDNCGIVLLGTTILKQMVLEGIKKQKVNWYTGFDRCGAKIIEITPPSEKDVAAIVRANGLDSEAAIIQILNDSQNEHTQYYSLRRVKRLVHAAKQKGAIN